MVLYGKALQGYPVNAGVPQDAIRGPRLFLLYINYPPDGLVVKVLDSQTRGLFHPSEVDKRSTRNFWELSGKK